MIESSIIRDNVARKGGGIFTEYNIQGSITNCTFRGNSAFSGGGMFNKGASIVFTNTIFDGNQATNGGGLTLILNAPVIKKNITTLFYNLTLL